MYVPTISGRGFNIFRDAGRPFILQFRTIISKSKGAAPVHKTSGTMHALQRSRTAAIHCVVPLANNFQSLSIAHRLAQCSQHVDQ